MLKSVYPRINLGDDAVKSSIRTIADADFLSLYSDAARSAMDGRASRIPELPASVISVWLQKMGDNVPGSSPVLDVLNSLEDSGLASNDGWQWSYGKSKREVPFRSHVSFDGRVFHGDSDESLRVSDEDSWIRREFYAPGIDHRGCACRRIPILRPLAG